MIEHPQQIDRILAFCNEVALKTAAPLLDAGSDGVLLGEATCSPNFISPTLYRNLVAPHHKALVAGLKNIGHRFVGLHICGDISHILDDIIATGVDFLDVDYQVPAEKALAIADNRVALRGNLDPSADLRFARPDHTAEKTRALCKTIAGTRWIVSSGCDIPPNTPQQNLTALVTAAHTF
jgi:uroporphyrinogen decarboxylase